MFFQAKGHVSKIQSIPFLFKRPKNLRLVHHSPGFKETMESQSQTDIYHNVFQTKDLVSKTQNLPCLFQRQKIVFAHHSSYSKR
ncbi:hypothetical protein CEXT_317801 [Caerostris extrusa]|uniref:Uncharacterized protein n=1 Tax=Caerostris extrusa TaxID=172846 RepID=A0AAV4V2P3_CAEEX|nr:hypothetical protein CEXT_317801 [Caerostris extrusa]